MKRGHSDPVGEPGLLAGRARDGTRSGMGEHCDVSSCGARRAAGGPGDSLFRSQPSSDPSLAAREGQAWKVWWVQSTKVTGGSASCARSAPIGALLCEPCTRADAHELEGGGDPRPPQNLGFRGSLPPPLGVSFRNYASGPAQHAGAVAALRQRLAFWDLHFERQNLQGAATRTRRRF